MNTHERLSKAERDAKDAGIKVGALLQDESTSAELAALGYAIDAAIEKERQAARYDITNMAEDAAAIRQGVQVLAGLLPDEDVTYYVHKLSTEQAYGGPEEGGWYYDFRQPLSESDPDHEPVMSFEDEDDAHDYCRAQNEQEKARREGLEYGYTSVLSHRERFFTYTVETTATVEPTPIPHYE